MMTPLARVLTVGLAGAALVAGIALGSPGSGGTAAAPSVPYSGCPGTPSIGVLHGGDRVLATGRDASGGWIEVRSPDNRAHRVWVEAALVHPDRTFADLPVMECPPEAVAFEGLIEPATTTTTTEPEVTTTTVPGATTTTAPGVTTTQAPATTLPPVTTTTLPPAPTVGTIGRAPTEIWEMYFDGTNYSCNEPNTSTITAAITAPAGVQSVQLHWNFGGTFGQKAMTPAGGSNYSAVLGPFPEYSIASGSVTINITVMVLDTLGRSASNNSTVTLHDCTFV